MGVVSMSAEQIEMTHPQEHLCVRCETPLEKEDVRCAICGLPVERVLEAGHLTAGAALRLQVVRCSSCHAALRYDVKLQAPRCAFCGAVTKLEARVDPLESPDAILPFAVSPNQAEAALREFLGRAGWFRPGDLRSGASISQLTPLFWAGFLCEAEAALSFTADTNLGSGKARWAPFAGQHELSIDRLLVSASRGLTQGEAASLASHYRLESAQLLHLESRAQETTPIDTALEAEGEGEAGQDLMTLLKSKELISEGTIVESFDLHRSSARQVVVQAIEGAAGEAASQWVPGSRMRNFKIISRLTKLRSHRLLLPAYVMAYRYRNESYRVIVHGQDASRVIGKTPLSPWKILLALGLVALGLAALGLAMASRS